MRAPRESVFDAIIAAWHLRGTLARRRTTSSNANTGEPATHNVTKILRTILTRHEGSGGSSSADRPLVPMPADMKKDLDYRAAMMVYMDARPFTSLTTPYMVMLLCGAVHTLWI
jgi:hypothetical protein